MAHITIEYIILMPILIMQIFLFPLTASWLMNIWVTSRSQLALQDVASHLGSTIQQLYLSLNHATIAAGKVSYTPGLPVLIENSYYTANASIRTVGGSPLNSSNILEMTVTLVSTGNKVSTTVVLGPNVVWQNSVFMSNATNPCVSGEKNQTGTIFLQFGS
ncbi:MAG: hypothetical protein QXJ02_03335 [Candidatus Bathyarchaeia archaeon]